MTGTHLRRTEAAGVRGILALLLGLCLLFAAPGTRAEGTDLKSLQERLLELGYEIGTADGIYTSSAGFCYVGAYQENGVTLIAAVMGEPGRNMAWTDLKRLFAYGMTAAE